MFLFLSRLKPGNYLIGSMCTKRVFSILDKTNVRSAHLVYVYQRNMCFVLYVVTISLIQFPS